MDQPPQKIKLKAPQAMHIVHTQLGRSEYQSFNSLRILHLLGSIALLMLGLIALGLDVRLFQDVPSLSKTSLVLISLLAFITVMVFSLHLRNQTLKRHWNGPRYSVKGVRLAYLKWWCVACGVILVSIWPMIHYHSRPALLFLLCFAFLSLLVCPSPKMVLPYHHPLSKSRRLFQ